jgi:ATP-binding cassette subfamily B protein
VCHAWAADSIWHDAAQCSRVSAAKPQTVYDVWKPPEQRPLRQLPGLLASSLGLLWGAARGEFMLVAILQVVSGGLGGVMLVLVKNLLDAIQGASATDDFAPVLGWLGALAVLTLLTGFSGSVQWERQRVLGELVNRRAMLRIFDVASVAGLEAFETPDFHNRMERAWMSSGARPMQLTQSLLGLMSSLTGVLGVVVALFAVLPILVPVLLVGSIPVLLLTARSSKALHAFDFGMTPVERRRMYIGRVLTHREHAHEVIAFGLAGFLTSRWRALHDERLAQMRKLVRERMLYGALSSVGNTLVFVAPVALVSYLLVIGAMQLPQAVAAATGILLLRPTMQGVIWGAAQLYECALFLEDYERFVRLKDELVSERGGGPAPVAFSRLRLEDVSFTYPGIAEPALRDVSLEIDAGQIVALVGENGSGKTTLAKVLSGLYKPARGRVLWDETDTAHVEPAALRRSVAVLFQDFCKYLLDVHENIGVGRHERLAEPDSIRQAAEHAGADGFIKDLPQGYQTLLGPEFEGGYNLSVGQWQRMALARAFLRDAPLIILDEPTAALDARAEHELFDSMRTLFAGRTVLLISHRFSSVRSADRIFVLHKGQLVEQGTHDELIQLHGQYAELFTLQAAAYQKVLC